MPQQMIWFFVSIAFSFVAWGMLIARYIWPRLRLQERVEALRPLLILHSFRFVGLAKDEDEERRHNREEEEDDEEEEKRFWTSPQPQCP